ncbi:MAG: PH domain-containing protein [Nocardioidaceae bacterium]
MSSPASPPMATAAAPAVAPWRRLSPLMLLVHPIREIGRAVPGLLALLFVGSGAGHGPLWGLVGAGIVAAVSLSRWFTTRYRVSADQVQIREGLFRRRTLAARLERVRTVDVTSSFLHRALGLARVEIGTGVSDRKGSSALRLDGLAADHAARLRGELLHRADATGGTPSLDVPADGLLEPGLPEAEIARLDPAWLRFAPFTLSGVVTGLAILGFGWRLVSETQVDVGTIGPLHSVSAQLSEISLWLAVAEVAVGAAVFVALASTVRYVLAFWGFRLTRHRGGSFHVARGLLTTRATSIDVDRLRGVGISEPLLLRLLGGARTIAIATGLEVGRGASPAGRGGTVLLPDAPLAAALRVASVVTGRPDVVDAALVPHGSAATGRRYTRALGGALAVLALTGLVWWVLGLRGYDWAAGVVLLLGAAPLAADRARNLGHRVAGGYLVTQSGSLVRRKAILETDAIIGWNVRQSLFQRRVGVLTLSATTAAGRQFYRILDVTPTEARRIADAATPGLLSQFGPS